MLDADAQVTRVDCTSMRSVMKPHDAISVGVTMNVCAEPAKTLLVHRYVAHDHAVQDVVRANVTKVSSVVPDPEDVVVALDQHLVAVQAAQCIQVSASYRDVAQVIDFVARTYAIVPPTHHLLVHLLGATEGTQGSTILSLKDRTGLLVTEVSIGHHPDLRHDVLPFGRCGRSRTDACGFGDRRATVTLHTYDSGALGRTRTDTVPVLRRRPLPIGIRGRDGSPVWSRTTSLSRSPINSRAPYRPVPGEQT